MAPGSARLSAPSVAVAFWLQPRPGDPAVHDDDLIRPVLPTGRRHPAPASPEGVGAFRLRLRCPLAYPESSRPLWPLPIE